MSFQLIVVLAIILVAVFFAGSKLLSKRRSFSTKGDCGEDCGCSSGGKKLRS
ncbi:MAG: FeoB-associated Cys-rich membrane protein [Acidobacteria bacterium]|nr:FeoB-associated Cys-rich membrane protein [Acidobacteriota bacterium]